MSLEEIKKSITALTPPEFQEIWSFVVSDEYERRNADRFTAEMIGDLQGKGELPHPDTTTEEKAKEDVDAVPEWKNPGTDHSKMYHFGDVVRYNGQLVRSTHRGLNHWEPDTLGFDGRIWEILEPEEPEETPDEPETSETPETEAPEDEPESSSGPDTPAWKPGIAVNPGQKYTHAGSTYEVIQGHTTQQGWEPPAVPALWKKL